MTDVTPTHPTSGFVIDDEDSEDDGIATAKQQRKEANLLGEALAYGQQLQEDYRDDIREDVQRVLRDAFSLLAYTDPRGSVVGHLLEESGRREVAEELNSAILGMGSSFFRSYFSFDGKEFRCTIGNGRSPCHRVNQGARRARRHGRVSYQCQGGHSRVEKISMD
jgi:hypothetical protein